MNDARGLIDWLYGFIRKPLAGWTSFIAVTIYFFFFLMPERYAKGFEDAAKIDSLTIYNLNSQLKEVKLERKDLQTKIDSTDCAEQMQKAIDFVNNFKSQLANGNAKKSKDLQKTNEFNYELEKYAENLEKSTQ
ncbi:hypothetical protein CLU96_1228 [Chryseobacterium sp. 52]|uniref:hypothetical protein n=1 Tax=Chryseobacterium sp. 52 TaxID=2035213 RepID=UPI000C18A079|nr:hypothetical protein [Chryseobacterium sp. 52]PIF44287.1 hypothetical protein CLU96_1228 [Chryseobacterium sp. 52]